MATITPTFLNLDDGSVVVFTWSTLTTTNDRGSAVEWAQWADRSIQVEGTFGAGGSLRWEGSNDGGTTYQALNDPQGNALNVTSAKIEQVLELSQFARPFITAGDGTTDLDVTLIMRRLTPART
jgi:hypothetical protein